MGTSNEESRLLLHILGAGEDLRLSGFHGYVAGYTARDAASVDEHIEELAAIGVAPPPEIPMFYPMPTQLFSTKAVHHIHDGSLTSGEVEPVYIRHRGRYYLGIGSDHTDRDLEVRDILESKVVCPKPLGPEVIPIDDLETFSLDDAVARSWVDGTLYQEGVLGELRTPADVVTRLLAHSEMSSDDFVCLGGTLPLLQKTFRAGQQWRVALEMTDGRTLEHTYAVTNSHPRIEED